MIRRLLLSVLIGERTIGMDVKSFPNNPEFADAQKKLMEAQINHLLGKTSIAVRVTEAPSPGEKQ